MERDKTRHATTICEKCGQWVYSDEEWGWYKQDGTPSYDGFAFHDRCKPSLTPSGEREIARRERLSYEARRAAR